MLSSRDARGHRSRAGSPASSWPRARNSWPTSIAWRTPSSVSYVSTRNVQLLGSASRTRGTPRVRRGRRRTSPTCARACRAPGSRTACRRARSTSRRSRRCTRARARARAVDALRAPHAELEHRPAARRLAHARRLGRDERLVVDRSSSSAVSTICACRTGPVTRSSGSCANTTVPSGTASTAHVKRSAPSVVEEPALEQRRPIGAAERREVVEIALVEAQPLEQLERGLDARRDRVAAAERRLAERQVEDGLALRDALLPVAVRHRELVQVGGSASEWRYSSPRCPSIAVAFLLV